MGACAMQEVGFDPRKIHSAGYSAGAMHTAYASFRRSSYLASVASYSGGIISPSAPPEHIPQKGGSARAGLALEL